MVRTEDQTIVRYTSHFQHYHLYIHFIVKGCGGGGVEIQTQNLLFVGAMPAVFFSFFFFPPQAASFSVNKQQPYNNVFSTEGHVMQEKEGEALPSQPTGTQSFSWVQSG